MRVLQHGDERLQLAPDRAMLIRHGILVDDYDPHVEGEGDGGEDPSGKVHMEDDTCDTISALYNCQTKNAEKLAIYDLVDKLKKPDTYDIGGSYTDNTPDFWFYYTTSEYPGPVWLLNLFVYHRQPGSVAIGISSLSKIDFIAEKNLKLTELPNTLKWYHLKSNESNQSNYIKTFSFTNIEHIDPVFHIPIKIQVNATAMLNETILKKIKLAHDLRALIVEQQKTDFILESLEQKQFPVHKIILAANSPVLREIIKKSDTNSITIELNDKEMEFLIEFLYTGTIKDILDQDCIKLLTIADKFQLSNLFTLIKFAIATQISVDNAIEVAILAEKYHLEELQVSAFEFIRNNQNVLETEGWNNLNDLNLTKKLLQYMHKHSNSKSFKFQ